MESNSTIHYSCAPKSSGAAIIALLSLALPFHILMAKILIKDIGLSIPRHLIMLSLTISDALQVFGIASLTSIAMALQLTTESFACGIIRDIGIFVSSLTVVASGYVRITFAIERMVICLHFLKYRILFRRSRVTKLLSSHWLFGLIVAAIATVTNDARKTETSVNEATSFQIICILTILPSAFIITAIYIRILLFSREWIRISPSTVSSNVTYATTFKQKQIRIAVVAGIICVAYIGCMVPVAMMYFLELTGLIQNSPKEKKFIICIGLLNNLLDPFIYGFGMEKTRQILIRMLRSVYNR